MEQIEDQVKDRQELAKQVLSWITCAKRPLTTTELQNVLAVEVGNSKLEKESIPRVEDMVSVCTGLVTVDQESNVIRLIHYTAEQYFDKRREAWFQTDSRTHSVDCVLLL